jgi:hypothetical protein
MNGDDRVAVRHRWKAPDRGQVMRRWTVCCSPGSDRNRAGPAGWPCSRHAVARGAARGLTTARTYRARAYRRAGPGEFAAPGARFLSVGRAASTTCWLQSSATRARAELGAGAPPPDQFDRAGGHRARGCSSAVYSPSNRDGLSDGPFGSPCRRVRHQIGDAAWQWRCSGWSRSAGDDRRRSTGHQVLMNHECGAPARRRRLVRLEAVGGVECD